MKCLMDHVNSRIMAVVMIDFQTNQMVKFVSWVVASFDLPITRDSNFQRYHLSTCSWRIIIHYWHRAGIKDKLKGTAI